MKFSIGAQFSKEFGFEESSIALRLTETLNNNLANNLYSEKVKKIYIGVICVSEGFEPFFKVRPWKFLKEESALEFELKLDFEQMINSIETVRKVILGSEVLKQLEIVLSHDLFTTDLEKEKFINDFKFVLKENGYFK